LRGHDGYFEASLGKGREALAVRIQIADPRFLFMIIERIRAMFDLNADWIETARTLRRDPLLAERIRAAPGLRSAPWSVNRSASRPRPPFLGAWSELLESRSLE
jgi:AlkA N-terminal domain